MLVEETEFLAPGIGHDDPAVRKEGGALSSMKLIGFFPLLDADAEGRLRGHDPGFEFRLDPPDRLCRQCRFRGTRGPARRLTCIKCRHRGQEKGP